MVKGPGYGSIGNGNGKDPNGKDHNGGDGHGGFGGGEGGDRDDGGGGGGGGNGWTLQQQPACPLTYTWTSLNVFAPGSRPSRSPLSGWLQRRPAAPRKHLLKNGESRLLDGMTRVSGEQGRIYG